MNNPCKIDARKRHAKSMENDTKMHPKLPKSEKYRKKRGPKIDAEILCEKTIKSGDLPGFWIDFLAVPGGKGGGRYLKIPD